MFNYPSFDVKIVREVDSGALHWPDRDDATDDSGLGCNREYADLRGLSWTVAKRVLALERELMARIENADDPEAECDAIDEELYESDENLLGLDPGVASTVVALSAARCIPFTSCNGGAFGGHHLEHHPLVAFFAKPHITDLLLAAATDAEIGLENHSDGCLVAYSRDIRQMQSFAESLISRRQSFNAVRSRKERRRSSGQPEAEQFKLSLPDSPTFGEE